MRSRKDYLITKTEVYTDASLWLTALKLDYEGYKCNTSILLQVLMLAAARVVSIYAACRDLADAPCDQTIRDALAATLPNIGELEKRLNRSLTDRLPKALLRKKRDVAIDLTLIPYHGQPHGDAREIYRSQAKSGTTHFHAYATAFVIHNGFRYTLALTRVEYGEAMKDVVQRLLQQVRRLGVKVRLTLLDKGFYSVEVITYLKRSGTPFVIPAMIRGRAPKGKPVTGLRALRKNKNGRYAHTLTGQRGDNRRAKTTVTICVASKDYTHEKTGKRHRKKLLYALWKVSGDWKEVRELYRKRFGIETSYRQMNQCRIKTCSRDPAIRLLLVGIALVLRNVWVCLHFRWSHNKYGSEPQLFLELLRLSEMLLWIEQVVQTILGADKTIGITMDTYQRTTEKYFP